uniref:Protein kinase domain-containing protein n=1 Tax=Arundo donax TaxID=35708 RepID=A0A0A9B699_ARUDO
MFAGLLVALIAFLVTEVFLHKRSNKRQGYFEEHGGQMLSRILKTEGNITFTFYDRGDIVKATRNFHKANIVGEGAHGTVYKAVLGVGTATVAVKRCKQIDKSRTMEFVQELVILCRVSHPNIVRLLGCCLHFEAPMLVYEFVPNGTLNDLLHGRRPGCRVTLATRLRIATEAADAIAYLHAPPHTTLHGDVKPDNILLGDGWVAKVSDFGCSTIDDNIQVVPKGTLAYLDPEFMQDFQLTEKSDVYSFGVVLVELLTGMKPLPKEQKNLTKLFQESMWNGTIGELLDTDIVEEGTMGVIHQAAELASRCIAVPGTERPAMGRVADELRRLSDILPESSEALQALEGHRYSYTATESETTGFYSLGSKAALSTELAR